jgi:Fe-S-cluster containining protein
MSESRRAVDVLRPETWVKYRPANCAGCHADCCTLPVRVTDEELFHLGFLRYEEVGRVTPAIVERVRAAGVVRSYHRGWKLFTLERRPNEDCVFLDDERRCRVYDRRPSVCRAFPKNAVRPGYCPSRRKGVPAPPRS